MDYRYNMYSIYNRGQYRSKSKTRVSIKQRVRTGHNRLTQWIPNGKGRNSCV